MQPYRLEMGIRLGKRQQDLYQFWGDVITIPANAGAASPAGRTRRSTCGLRRVLQIGEAEKAGCGHYQAGVPLREERQI
ncbi:hypothetical protein ACNKHS_00060 [Shigella flexneri]